MRYTVTIPCLVQRDDATFGQVAQEEIRLVVDDQTACGAVNQIRDALRKLIPIPKEPSFTLFAPGRPTRFFNYRWEADEAMTEGDSVLPYLRESDQEAWLASLYR